MVEGILFKISGVFNLKNLIGGLKRRANNIGGLYIDENWYEDPGLIKKEVMCFFDERFKQQQGVHPHIDEVQFRAISTEDNQMLCSKFEAIEIKEAIWECGCDKSLGPDGYNFRF